MSRHLYKKFTIGIRNYRNTIFAYSPAAIINPGGRANCLRDCDSLLFDTVPVKIVQDLPRLVERAEDHEGLTLLLR